MSDEYTIPKTATLYKEEQGVKWYIEERDKNTLNYMEFEGRVLAGGWVGPRWIFWALTSMTLEERARYHADTDDDYDDFMGAINIRIAHLTQKR